MVEASGDTRFDGAAVDASVVSLSRSRVMRVVFGALGFVFLGLGIAGWFVPGLPGTVNLLIALWLFSQSSERMHRWMLTNRWFGRALVDYKSGLGIPRRIKVIAVSCIVLAVGFSAGFVIDITWLRVLIVAIGVYGVWFVVSRPTREVEVARRAAAESAA
jgi:uncharacterized membrane protein YbaN (DUF454 family)